MNQITSLFTENNIAVSAALSAMIFASAAAVVAIARVMPAIVTDFFKSEKSN